MKKKLGGKDPESLSEWWLQNQIFKETDGEISEIHKEIIIVDRQPLLTL
ncbi:MAG: hypothetical protein HFJ86_04410 [Oscillospiraceae bacterium]|jgi:hypothetical protein|nr:hypothetical protein [Oscillospiraceae bacterium]